MEKASLGLSVINGICDKTIMGLFLYHVNQSFQFLPPASPAPVSLIPYHLCYKIMHLPNPLPPSLAYIIKE